MGPVSAAVLHRRDPVECGGREWVRLQWSAAVGRGSAGVVHQGRPRRVTGDPGASTVGARDDTALTRWNLEFDDSGGDVTVDGTACYEGLEIWRRHVAWDAERLVVNDEVALAGETRDIILFRWHLGTKDRAVIDGEGTSFSVSWPGLIGVDLFY